MMLALVVLTACPARGYAVVVESAAHRMDLCAQGAAEHTYEVALGSGGAVPVTKRIGWAVTPMGTFSLVAPRASAQFHVFIPLGNPAPGRFSAWAIGLHGPPRSSRDAGHSNIESDWTWGCIAVSSDEEIDEIAAWTRANKVVRIEVR